MAQEAWEALGIWEALERWEALDLGTWDLGDLKGREAWGALVAWEAQGFGDLG